MTSLLYIEASPRKSRSHSIALAQDFIIDLQSRNRGLSVDTFDLWSEDLPRFDGEVLDAKYALLQGSAPTGLQVNAWKTVTDVIERFSAADLYVISTPMWNFGVPYKLKHLIDVIAQPSHTYQARADAPYGEWGLLTNKKAVVISARGGTYQPGTGVEDWDFQSLYLERVLNFLGIKDVSQVVLELTAVDKDTLPNRVAAAKERLAEIVPVFAA